MPRLKKYMPRNPSELKPLSYGWLHLEGVVEQGIIEETEVSVVVQARTSPGQVPKCAQCNSSTSVNAWDIRPINIRDVEQNGKLICIVLMRQRFFCKKCKRTFSPPLPFLQRGRLGRTNRLTQKTKRLVDERHTSLEVAKATGLSRRTVQAIATETAKEQPTPSEVFRQATAAEDAACVIQIDDAHPSNGSNTAILLNGKPLELLDAYNRSKIEDFFISLDNRDKVKIYVSDGAQFLIDLGRKYFPEALIVADPFHVVRDLLKGFNSLLKPFEEQLLREYTSAINAGGLVRPIRTATVNPGGAKRRISAKKVKDMSREPSLVEVRLLFHKKEGKLNEVERDAISFLIDRFPGIRAGYVYLQGVMALYHAEVAPADASRTLDKLEQELLAAKLSPDSGECFLDFRNLCRKRRDAICAFWACAWANAEAEAQNNVIKDIDRRGHGLGFEELRRRWLHGQSTTTILERYRAPSQSNISTNEGPPMKQIRALRRLASPEPVPMVGPGGMGWLFDSLS